MKLDLKRPLACLDLETTGTNISSDRIVEISIVKIHPDNKKETFTQRINPMIPIPPEASAVHGIRDEDVKDKPTFQQTADSLLIFLENCDLAGFNIHRFDLPILTEEFLRYGKNLQIENRAVIDVQKIFHRKERRDLTAAYKFYCDKNLENAHSAEADASATAEILEAQLDKYPDLENDVEFLKKISRDDSPNIDPAGKFRWEGKTPVFNFGQYRGKSISEVKKENSRYIDWILKGDFPIQTKNVLRKIVNGTNI